MLVRGAGGACARIGPVAVDGQRQRLGHVTDQARIATLWAVAPLPMWASCVGDTIDSCGSTCLRIAERDSAVIEACRANSFVK